jgi:hypothetical protein
LGTGYTKREKCLAAPVSNIVDIIVDLAPYFNALNHDKYLIVRKS